MEIKEKLKKLKELRETLEDLGDEILWESEDIDTKELKLENIKDEEMTFDLLLEQEEEGWSDRIASLFEGQNQLWRTDDGREFVVLCDNSVMRRYEDLLDGEPIFPMKEYGISEVELRAYRTALQRVRRAEKARKAAAALLGSAGGQSTSEKKAAASRVNGRKGGRPKKK